VDAAARFWSQALGREVVGSDEPGYRTLEQRFCMVNPQRGPLPADANQWP
jgi:hypothetical protein